MKIFALALLLVFIIPTNASADASMKYVPELTGMYVLGSVYPNQEETRKSALVDVPWVGSQLPKFATYEISGVLKEPIPSGYGSLEPDGDATKINSNSWFSRVNGWGVGWGAILNQSIDWRPGFLSLKTQFSKESGQFYLGATFNPSECNCSLGFPTSPFDFKLDVKAAFFTYDMYASSAPTYLDTGFVFIESARVGLTDSPLSVYSPPLEKIVFYSPIPEASRASNLLLGLITIALFFFRNRFRHSGQAALAKYRPWAKFG